MRKIQSVSIDNEVLSVFDANEYQSDGVDNKLFYFLDLIISETAALKYFNQPNENVHVVCTYEDGSSIERNMKIQYVTEVYAGCEDVPTMELETEIPEFENPEIIMTLDDFIDPLPKLREDITISQIREVEIPYYTEEFELELAADLINCFEDEKENINKMIIDYLYSVNKKGINTSE